LKALVSPEFTRTLHMKNNRTSNHYFRGGFIYDGLGRMRERVDYGWNGSGWIATNTVLYVYDGWRVIQERDGNNVPTVSYTRGNDLSGTLQGAGGIGGLLARSDGYSSGNFTTHGYYFCDGNGNITCMLDYNPVKVASYRYDPFGNTISKSGTLADANVYRFSSKEIHVNSGMYYYGYRFYDPNLQRWINRDPLSEPGFELIHEPVTRDFVRRIRYSTKYVAILNLYALAANRLPGHLDALGLFWFDFWTEVLEPADSTTGNPLTCGLVSTTDPIQGDPAPGNYNHNGQSACIWRCGQFGDQPLHGTPTTAVTFAPPGKPCKPPTDCPETVKFQGSQLDQPNPYE
jgi:RHS repeat-associated protein